MVIIDENFIKGFDNQIGVLTKLQKAVAHAIADARKKRDIFDKNRGKNVEDVLDPMQLKRSPGGPSKDHKDQHSQSDPRVDFSSVDIRIQNGVDVRHIAGLRTHRHGVGLSIRNLGRLQGFLIPSRFGEFA